MRSRPSSDRGCKSAVPGKSQHAELRKIISLPEKRDLRLDFHYSWSAVPSSFAVQCRLFPYDPRHRTFLNIYQGGQLEQQQIFEGEKSSSEYRTGSGQSVGDVVRQFLFEGVHHIFIGPDHILFVVGLLLLGGGVGRLLKIVTAFTFAHSITLGLATFHIVSPPASLIEPAIALSIVFVGASAFLGTKQHDPRLLFAFCFGLIHGFGFANALQEMMLRARHSAGRCLLSTAASRSARAASFSPSRQCSRSSAVVIHSSRIALSPPARSA